VGESQLEVEVEDVLRCWCHWMCVGTSVSVRDRTRAAAERRLHALACTLR
jgi:hypothetical protein